MNRFAAELPFGFGQLIHIDIKTQLIHHRHIGAELDTLVAHRSDVRTDAFSGKKVGISPLHEDAFYRISVVAGPEFGKIFERFVVAPAAAARTKHHRHIGIFLLDALQHLIQPSDIFDEQVRLILLQIKGVGVSQHAVAVPFEIGQVGILAQKLVHDAEHEVLYLRIA